MVGTGCSTADKARLPAADKSQSMHQLCVCECVYEIQVIPQCVSYTSSGQCVMRHG